jgi:hypothetical protein
MIKALRKVPKQMRDPLEVTLTCVRWLAPLGSHCAERASQRS